MAWKQPEEFQNPANNKGVYELAKAYLQLLAAHSALKKDAARPEEVEALGGALNFIKHQVVIAIHGEVNHQIAVFNDNKDAYIYFNDRATVRELSSRLLSQTLKTVSEKEGIKIPDGISY